MNQIWKYHNPKFEYEQIFFDYEWPWAGHKYFAYDLIANIKPKVIVELGTHMGTSFFSMCQAVKDFKLNTKLFAIDTWQGDKHTGLYNESVFNEVNKIKNKFYRLQKIKLLRMTFDEAVSKFKDDSIDILHIDGLHTYEAVKHDFNNWFDKVKKTGIIMLHDTCEKKDDFGVYKLWNEIKKSFFTVEFTHSHGLGVIFKNKIYEKKYKNYVKKWLSYYPQLAENLILKNKLLIKEKEIEKLKEDINKITSSKTYKLWQAYCKIRDKILGRNEKNN